VSLIRALALALLPPPSAGCASRRACAASRGGGRRGGDRRCRDTTTTTDLAREIFRLCEFILSNTQRQSLLNATLATLQRFLTWIPLGYIFETQLLSTLVHKVL
jgi:hypothetical protein